MGMIVATYLLLMEEEDAFWMMVATVEDLLPSSYYSPSLIGVQADQVCLIFLFSFVARTIFRRKEVPKCLKLIRDNRKKISGRKIKNVFFQLVLRGLIATYLPPVDSLMQEHDIELSLITLNWFLTLYSSVLHIKLLLRSVSSFGEIFFPVPTMFQLGLVNFSNSTFALFRFVSK